MSPCGIFAHSSFTILASSSLEVAPRLLTLFAIRAQRSSITFKSGDRAGQGSKNVTFFETSHSFVDFEVCDSKKRAVVPTLGTRDVGDGGKLV
jgi:hypothetical protein